MRVTDSGNATYTEAFTITVADVNEAPSDLVLDNTSITENAANGTSVGTVTGTDPDAGETFTYALTDDAGGRFAIDANTGAITVADGSLLNHEDAASHGITVRVTDSGNATYDESFTITVADINETPTDLTLNNTSITENAANGTPIGTISANDPDAGETFTYALTDDAGGRFAIDANTGAITVADGSLLNHEDAASHSITVRVTDSGNATYDESFTITVADVNEAPSDLVLDNTSITENAANGTSVGIISASDPDAGESFTYALTDDAGGRFTIDASTGAITVADGSLLNHEDAASHGITVRVTDSGGQTYTEAFTITVADVNEAPSDLVLDNTSITENAANGTPIGTITASDPDAGETFTYALTDDAGGRFAIDASTGAITVANGSLLNHEDAASHGITVRVTDSGNATYDESFTITVADVNEAPSDLVFHSVLYEENFDNGAEGWSRNVTENLEPFGEFLGRFSTIGEAEIVFKEFALPGTQSEIIISFDVHEVSNWDSESFFVYIDDTPVAVEENDQSNLEVNSNTQQENETHSFSFRVETTATTVKIGFGIGPNQAPDNAVLGVDNLTITANTSENLKISENTANGTPIGTITASDPDAGETFTYALTDDAGGRFAIDANTGAITVADGSLLNHEDAASHSITVRVTDSGNAIYDESFTITVADVNEVHTAETDYLVTRFGETARIDVFANDTTKDDFMPLVASVDTPANGATVINPDNTISYTPNPGFSGGDQFTYVIDNGSGEQTTATVFVNVTPPPHIQYDNASLTQSGGSDFALSAVSRTTPETAERVLAYETNLEGQLSAENLQRTLGTLAKTLYDVNEEEFSQRILDFQSIQNDGPLFFRGSENWSPIWQDFIETNQPGDQEKIQEEETEKDAPQPPINQTDTPAQLPAGEENPGSGQESRDNNQKKFLDANMDQEEAPYQGFSAQLAQLSEGFERSRRDLVDVINRL